MREESDKLVRTYIDMWNETDERRRRSMIDAVCTPGCEFVDARSAVAGRDAIEALIGGLQSEFPGFVFRLAGRVDGHHDVVRFNWAFGLANAATPATQGLDVAVVENGQLRTIYNFIDGGTG
ncbi:nuclear transport factor 2 family protein [Inquilinus sp. OTU3971]|uniref:nuclear transport factor 2 family protein n=1 Tax=Inquilinus sp. OTU3971 TaxID=3043855 RepID=UPI00313C8F62